MDKLLNKVRRVLRESFPGCEVDLDPPENGQVKLTGTLIWKGFSGKDQLARQRRVWKALREHLTEGEQQKVSLILTVTPRELAVMLEG